MTAMVRKRVLERIVDLQVYVIAWLSSPWGIRMRKRPTEHCAMTSFVAYSPHVVPRKVLQ
jgi:hypothetical protein